MITSIPTLLGLYSRSNSMVSCYMWLRSVWNTYFRTNLSDNSNVRKGVYFVEKLDGVDPRTEILAAWTDHNRCY
jgi:hypothetical protein